MYCKKSTLNTFAFSFGRLWPCKTLPGGDIVRKSPINTMSSLMARGEATWDNRVRFNKIATLNFDILAKISKKNKIATSNFDILAKISKIFCSRLNLDPLPPSIGSRQPANQHCGRAAKYYKVQYKYRHVKNTNTDENSNI